MSLALIREAERVESNTAQFESLAQADAEIFRAQPLEVGRRLRDSGVDPLEILLSQLGRRGQILRHYERHEPRARLMIQR